jgi:hypothetical protein
MRISIISGDPGYDEKHTRRVKNVYLNGEVIQSPITADEEQGFVLCLISDGNGGVKKDPVSGDYELERLEGRVHIELHPPGARDWDKNRKGAVKVRVALDTNKDLLVQVFSVVRPGALKQGRLKAQLFSGSGTMQICQSAGILAGAIAEALCEQFGDTMDPSEVASTAIRECSRMIQDL